MSVARIEALPDGRRSRRAVAGPFEVTRLSFPAAFAHGVIDPSRGYLVVVLEGAVCKTFSRDATTLARASFACVPAGAAHSSVFASCPSEVLVVRSAQAGCEEPFGDLLREWRHVDAAVARTLAWRMARELDARDSSATLALEGLALQLLATAGRAGRGTDERATVWLRTVRELLHEHVPQTLSLHELGDAVGRHPSHVARAFRREYGVTIAAYVRALRLEWAAAELAGSDASVARIASDAGFADQSHFTRAFRASHGITPGRYRRNLQVPLLDEEREPDGRMIDAVLLSGARRSCAER